MPPNKNNQQPEKQKHTSMGKRAMIKFELNLK